MTSWVLAVVSLIGADQRSDKDVKVEPTAVTIPGEGWRVEFSSPPLTRFAGTRRETNSSFGQQAKTVSISRSTSRSRRPQVKSITTVSSTTGRWPSETR